MDEVAEKLRARTTRTIVTKAIDGIGDVQFRAMGAKELVEVTAAADPDECARKLVAACVIDNEGKEVFASADVLVGMDASLFMPLHREAAALNKLDAGRAENFSEAPPSST